MLLQENTLRALKSQEIIEKVNKEQMLEIDRQLTSIINKDRAILELRSLLTEGKDKI